jgi:hypothetical protein
VLLSWLYPGRRCQLFSADCASLKVMPSMSPPWGPMLQSEREGFQYFAPCRMSSYLLDQGLKTLTLFIPCYVPVFESS